MAYENEWITNQTEQEPVSWNYLTWSGLSNYYGGNVWTDGTDVYYSQGSTQYVLDRANSVWISKTWSGLTNFYGSKVWTDGEDIYYSDYEYGEQYVLNKATSTWTYKQWSGFTILNGANIWTDGEDTYYSYDQYQYVLDKANSTWISKSWNGGLSSFRASNVWTDGENIYYSQGSAQYILDKATSTWNTKTWNGYEPTGSYIWRCGDFIFCSAPSYSTYSQYVLDKATSTWNTKAWNGVYYSALTASNIWADGDNIYLSDGQYQYKLNRLLISEIPYRENFPEMIKSVDVHDEWVADEITGGNSIPYRIDFPELIEPKTINDEWVTHEIPDPELEGLRFLKLSYNLTVNWEGGGTNNITVSTDIPEAFKAASHLSINSSASYHEVWMGINTEIPQCPYQCRMKFDENASALLESLNYIAPRFYVYRQRTASAQVAFEPATLEEDLYSESRKNFGLMDDKQYISSPYNYACEPRVIFNHGSGGAFPTTPGTTVVTIDIIFAFTDLQTDRYNDLRTRYPDHVTPFVYSANAIPYRFDFPEFKESIDIKDEWLISGDIPYRWRFPKLIKSSGTPQEPPASFTFKGRSSAEFGSIEILPLCLKHEEKTDFINFITGNPYVMETSVLRSKVITITLNLKDISPANIDRVNSWLIGTGKLVLSRDPGRYYIASCNNALTGQKLIRLGKVVVQFNVMPYKYDAKESDSFEAVSLADETLYKTAAIFNKGNAPAESVYRITGTGDIEIYNVQTEKTVSIKGLTEYCIIDIKARKVTDESNLNILDRTYGDIFDLMPAPGDNYFFLTGSVTALEVKKKTRWY